MLVHVLAEAGVILQPHKWAWGRQHDWSCDSSLVQYLEVFYPPVCKAYRQVAVAGVMLQQGAYTVLYIQANDTVHDHWTLAQAFATLLCRRQAGVVLELSCGTCQLFGRSRHRLSAWD